MCVNEGVSLVQWIKANQEFSEKLAAQAADYQAARFKWKEKESAYVDQIAALKDLVAMQKETITLLKAKAVEPVVAAELVVSIKEKS